MSTSFQTLSLDRAQTTPSPFSTSRTLALSIDTLDVECAQNVAPHLAEILLRFSPRLSYRIATRSSDSTSPRIWFFLDLSSHETWIKQRFGDEAHLVEAVLKTLDGLNHRARIAIADTPQAAQAFTAQHGFWISDSTRTRKDLDSLPLIALRDLEGLEEWTHPSRIEAMIGFFSLLGFQTLRELGHFHLSSFHERWGELGEKVYLRLQGLSPADPQPISPFISNEPLKSFVHLDYPVSIISLLLHEIEAAMKTLFARLESRRLVIRRLRVCLRCEYSNHEHIFNIEPSTPTRELRFFKLLLENRLDRIELFNPIKDLELEVDALPENEQQEGFDNQATLDQTKLSLLTSLLTQEGAASGFALLQDEMWPENTWVMNPEASINRISTDKTSVINASVHGELDETGFLPKFHYAAELEKAPRPALLLRKPRPLEGGELSRLHFYSKKPIERIEHGWWEERAGPIGTPTLGERRDYYVARDPHGRNLWLYQDCKSERFYLHGAFD